MTFNIPATFGGLEKLKKRSKYFAGRIKRKKNTDLGEKLLSTGLDITREQYLGICLRAFVINFLVLFIVVTSILAIGGLGFFYLIGPGIALFLGAFIFLIQSVYPQVYLARKQRDIEKNLLFALEDILVQINSGVPIFNILTNISFADYGVLSDEFKKAVKRISAGEPDVDVLADIGKRNPSIFFRRILWQMSNGLNAGSDMSAIIKDSIRTLNSEQLIQLQNYGNKLNPIIMFYMLITVIIPALSVTFITILASMGGLEKQPTIILFSGVYVFVMLFQVLFLGVIKSRRPSLLS
jgi:flagellar protein FlaJ